MKSILLFAGLMFLAAGCNRTHSQTVNSNLPLGDAANQTAVNKGFSLKTPTPKPIVERQPVNEADYTVVKFDYAKMRATTLGTQPLEIIKEVAGRYPDASIEDEELKAFDKFKVKITEHDLNHDGTAERIILSRGETGKEVQALHIFVCKNDKWHCIFGTEGDPDDPKVSPIEILTSANKNGFDLIKLTAETGAGDGSQEVRYYRMQKEQYQAVDCYDVVGASKKSVPCSSSLKYN